MQSLGNASAIRRELAAAGRIPYAAHVAPTIVENCGNTLILRCAGSENGGTSQFASRLIGDREVRRLKQPLESQRS